MSRLRVGIVGSGIGASHIEAYQRLPDLYEVVTLCDIAPERRDEVATRFGLPHQDATFEALLARDLDIVDVCTPSNLHFEQALMALDAGRHVVIEKPVARSLREVDALIAAEAASAGRASPIFQCRFGNGLQKFFHLRSKGFAARASMATSEIHWFRDSVYYDAAAWRGTWQGETGGCLTTHAIHVHDIVCEVMGPVRSLFARTANRVNGNETEDMAVLSLEFETGAFGASSATLGSREQVSRLRFAFDDLVAESGRAPYDPGFDPWTFPHDDPSAAATIQNALADFVPLPERFVGQFHRLHAALTGDAPLPVTLADARRSIELLTAAYWSSTTGETVTLPLGPDHPFYGGWLAAMQEDARG